MPQSPTVNSLHHELSQIHVHLHALLALSQALPTAVSEKLITGTVTSKRPGDFLTQTKPLNATSNSSVTTRNGKTPPVAVPSPSFSFSAGSYANDAVAISKEISTLMKHVSQELEAVKTSVTSANAVAPVAVQDAVERALSSLRHDVALSLSSVERSLSKKLDTFSTKLNALHTTVDELKEAEVARSKEMAALEASRMRADAEKEMMHRENEERECLERQGMEKELKDLKEKAAAMAAAAATRKERDSMTDLMVSQSTVTRLAISLETVIQKMEALEARTIYSNALLGGGGEEGAGTSLGEQPAWYRHAMKTPRYGRNRS